MTSIDDDRVTYCIRVKGRLGAEWTDRLHGMRLVNRDSQGVSPVTDLLGPVDQAALMGVLQQLYSLGATVLSVGRLDTGSAEEPVAASASPDINGNWET